MKKRMIYLLIYLPIIFYQFFNNFSSLLLRKINVFDIFKMFHFFKIFFYIAVSNHYTD